MGLILGMALMAAAGGGWLARTLFREGRRQKYVFNRPDSAAWYFVLTWLSAGGAAAALCFAWHIFALFAR